MRNKLVLKIDETNMTLDYSAFAPEGQFSETGVLSAKAHPLPIGIEWEIHVDSLNVSRLLVKAGFTRAGVPGAFRDKILRVPASSLTLVQVSSRRVRRKALKSLDATGTLPGVSESEVA